MNLGVGAFVISGPTAVGKGTLVSALSAAHPDVYISISTTTRRPRPGEIDGQHYNFVSDQEFDDLIAQDGFLEWATVHQTHRYGTVRQQVEDALSCGRPTILEIDLQGARQIRTTMPQATQIFIAPPSWDELVARLRGRGTETPEEMDRRLRTARIELAAENEFDHVIVNDTVPNAVAKLVELIGL